MAVKITELSDDWVLAKISWATTTSTTVEKDVVAGPCTLYFAHVNPTTDADEGDAVEDVHLKFWDHANPTHGTDEPEEVLLLKTYDAGSSNFYVTDTPLPINPPNGIEFETGLSVAISDSTGPGKTAGAGLASAIDLTLLIKKGS